MHSRRPAVLLAAGLLVVAGGTAGLLLTRHGTPALRPPALGVNAVPAPTNTIVAPPPSAQPGPVSRPVALTIPLIGVQTKLMYLGLKSDGELQVPPLSMVAVAGWYTGSPRPGAIGSAIIVGHIDSHNGPGVFWRLSTLRRGDKIYVRRANDARRVPRHLDPDLPEGPLPDGGCLRSRPRPRA